MKPSVRLFSVRGPCVTARVMYLQAIETRRAFTREMRTSLGVSSVGSRLHLPSPSASFPFLLVFLISHFVFPFLFLFFTFSSAFSTQLQWQTMQKPLKNLLALYFGSIQNARIGIITISTSNNPGSSSCRQKGQLSPPGRRQYSLVTA